MVKNLVRLAISTETRDLLIDKCKKEYLNHHPEMMHIHITQDKILFEVCSFYMRQQ